MPRGVAIDEEDNIYVVDKMNSRIQKFSPSGEHLASVGKKGNGELEFDWPKAISIHPHTKNVYVTEANNHKSPHPNTRSHFHSYDWCCGWRRKAKNGYRL